MRLRFTCEKIHKREDVVIIVWIYWCYYHLYPYISALLHDKSIEGLVSLNIIYSQTKLESTCSNSKIRFLPQ